jgi:hypothetical protein
MFQGDGEVIDGYVVVKKEPEKDAEYNVAGVYAAFRDKASGATTKAILWGIESHPLTLSGGGKTWVVDLRKRRFQLPFTVRLDKFTFETHPGTMQPRVFLSDVTKIENGREQALKITMNEPLRYKGYTLYQASFGPEGAPPGSPHYSVFEVVSNPADQWPKWACYVIAFGLLWHFAMKLLRFVKSENRRTAELARTNA